MLKRPLPGSARLLLGAGIAMLASSAAAATLWQLQPMRTVLLPAAALPARPALPGIERVVAMPVLPVAPVSLAPIAEAPADGSPVMLAAAEPRRAAVPEIAVTPMPAPAAERPAATFQPPRVTHVRLADPPVRNSLRDFEREATANVVVKVDVDAQGRPANPQVVKNELGQAYDESALRAVKRWKFEPARRNGIAVASTILVPVPFDFRKQDLQVAEWAKPVINSRPVRYGPPIVVAAPPPPAQ